ncbi:MAG: zf-HC2 domain-containing protein [Corynebacterium sp.]|nr:zf-HC2 domain-containing protein [Corynebacterium sp.]
MTMKKECDCTEVHISVHELLNEELTAAECARMREHVQGCESCQSILTHESELLEILQKSCACSAPPTLEAKIRYSLRVHRSSEF